MDAGGKDAARAAEEEALKRNTDCVYFLASPLTCKKGVECEYRHSEGARVNPRDCWYWMNGNCLNPKCGFRHPPLDGLMGTSTTIASGSASPAPPKIPTQASSTYSTPQNHSKQVIPCFYFQRGACLKGDRCPFVHGPVAVPNPATQQATKVTMPVSEPQPAIRKTSWTLDKVPKQNIPNETSTQPIFAATLVKPQSKAETPAVVNRLPRKESTQSNIELRSETTGAPAVASSAPSRSQSRQSEPLDDECQNDREGDEYVRESSPGFDVLVDDENEEAGYFGEENEYGDASGHEGGSVNHAADFNYHHSSDYETASKFRREPYCSDADEYGYYVPANDYRTQEHHRAFPERDSERQAVSSRRRLRGDDNLVVVDGSDLRHQLLKKRRVNASRSGVSPDPHGPYWHDDHYFDEQRHRSHDRRSDQRNGRREVSASKRLQGRISMPRRNPGDSNGDLHPDRGRSWGRLSTGKASNYSQRSIHERLNRRSNDNFRPDERSFGGVPRGRGDEQGNIDFAGPKSLSELKSIKVSNASEQGSTGSDNDSEHLREQRNAKFGKPLDHQDSSEIAEFEGPQPLSVILKRKREAAAANSKVASTTSAVASPGLHVLQHTESSGKDNQVEDPEAAAVDIEEQGEDPIIEGGDVDQSYAIADGFEEGVEYSKDDDQEFEDYQEGDEYYQEYDDEYAEYEAEDVEGTYKGGEGEGGEDDFAKNVAVLH